MTTRAQAVDGRVQDLSVHKVRSAARREERRLQARINDKLDNGNKHPIYTDAGAPVPDWARGVRTQRAGLFQHVVQATEYRGH